MPRKRLSFQQNLDELEQLAHSAGNTEAVHFLREATMSFFAARAARPSRQVDVRMYLES